MPLVVPFVHTGMQEIMPVGANFPRIGKMVWILDPFACFNQSMNLPRF